MCACLYAYRYGNNTYSSAAQQCSVRMTDYCTASFKHTGDTIYNYIYGSTCSEAPTGGRRASWTAPERTDHSLGPAWSPVRVREREGKKEGREGVGVTKWPFQLYTPESCNQQVSCATHYIASARPVGTHMVDV